MHIRAAHAHTRCSAHTISTDAPPRRAATAAMRGMRMRACVQDLSEDELKTAVVVRQAWVDKLVRSKEYCNRVRVLGTEDLPAEADGSAAAAAANPISVDAFGTLLPHVRSQLHNALDAGARRQPS
jgi:hypothetical protein